MFCVLAVAAWLAAPADYRVRLDTTRGPIVIAVHREWAPNGADRFYELVAAGYFDDSRFFRVVKGPWRSSASPAIPRSPRRGGRARFPTTRAASP